MPEYLPEYCYGCMRKIAPGERVCPGCGWEHSSGNAKQPSFALPCGTQLREGKYLLGRVLGQGGFGITYVGLDLALELKVAIKEFYPTGNVSRSSGTTALEWHTTEELREAGRTGFVKEARKMAKIHAIPSVVSVRDVFYENGTAYIVMDFVEGETLHDRLMRTGFLPPADCLKLLRPAMEALEEAHGMGLVHRDISPDNLMIGTNGRLWILDLGAAKEISMGEDEKSQSSIPVMRKGFSPPEQVGAEGKSGPWTDVYAMCATLCWCMTGKLLPDAMNRFLGKEVELPDTIPPKLQAALLHGLALKSEERIQTMKELVAELDRAMEPDAEPKPEPKPQPAPEQKPQPAPEQKPQPKPAAGEETISRIRPPVEQETVSKTRPPAEPPPEIVLDTGRKRFPPAAIAGIAAAVVLVAVLAVLFGSGSGGKQNSKAPVTDEPVYAVLYADGEMVFQNGDKTESGREVTAVYPVDMAGYKASYSADVLFTDPTIPWYYKRGQIQIVSFAARVYPQSTAYWFCGCGNLEEIRNIGKLDTAGVIDMKFMFYGCSRLRSLDVTGFDTRSVTDMSCMFKGCSGLTTLDVTGFDTRSVTDMSCMFKGCSGLRSLDATGLDTGSVMNMLEMFSGCSGLRLLDVTGFDTGSVTNMTCMFYGCSGLTALDVTGFDTGNVTSMVGMFDRCSSLTSLKLSGFNTENVTSMANMFSGCSGLTALDVTGFNTENVTRMSFIFDGCSGLTALDVTGFDTGSVTYMTCMFSGCSGLNTIYASDRFTTMAVTQSERMFTGCTSLVGGAGTLYDEAHTDAEYSRIDGGTYAPGYFTAKE